MFILVPLNSNFEQEIITGEEDMISTRETPPDPSSHIVLTFTSATNSPVTTWKCDAIRIRPTVNDSMKQALGQLSNRPVSR